MTPQAFWNNYLRSYDQLIAVKEYRDYLHDLAIRVGAEAGKALLDAGSGTGNLSMCLRQRGTSVTSLDFSEVGLEIHREKDHDAFQIQASLEEPLQLPSENYDGVTCASVLFALSESGCHQALREFHRILKPGGKLVVTAARPELSKMEYLFDHLRTQFRSQPFSRFLTETIRSTVPILKVLYYNYRMYLFSQQQHYRRFTSTELVTLVEHAGFQNVRYDVVLGKRMHCVTAEKAI